MMGYWGLNNYGFMGGIFMVVWWALIIIGVILAIKWFTNQDRGSGRTKPALEILKERYAKGEIDKKEFEEKKKDLL